MRDIVLAPSIRVHRADRSLAALVSKMLACADQRPYPWLGLGQTKTTRP